MERIDGFDPVAEFGAECPAWMGGHEFVEARRYEDSAGRHHLVIRCQWCGKESDGWTKEES